MSHTRNYGGSVSSAGSLTFSDYSVFSWEGSSSPRTPPPCSPRASSPAFFHWDDSPSSVSSQSSIEDDQVASPLSKEAALALKRLDLHVPTWSPPASEEFGLTIQAASPSPKQKMKKRPSHLKMDFSNVRRFEAPSINTPNTAMLVGAPLIGCLPTPSPTSLNFNITPRPGLVSRFSDDSSPASSPASCVNDKSQPFSSTNPNSARASVPAGHNVHSNSWPSPQPITPRTVDALDVFGITSNVSSCLMRRAGSRDKPSPLSRSPENSRAMARSPLGMPSLRPKMARKHSSPLVDMKSAPPLYPTLLPELDPNFEAEVAHTPPALNTPFEWAFEADPVPSSNKQPDNPYFMSAFR